MDHKPRRRTDGWRCRIGRGAFSVNDDGGSSSASDFRFSVNGGTPVTFESDGSNMLSSAAGTYNRFDVYWNGTGIRRIWVDGTALTDTSWRHVTLTETGTGGSDRVSFFESDTDTDDRGALIDDVQLKPQ